MTDYSITNSSHEQFLGQNEDQIAKIEHSSCPLEADSHTPNRYHRPTLGISSWQYRYVVCTTMLYILAYIPLNQFANYIFNIFGGQTPHIKVYILHMLSFE